MAVTNTLLDQGQATAPITTASASPGTNKLQILVVVTTLSSTVPTVSGCGLTWVNIFNLQVRTSNNYVNVYRAMGTPSTGSLSISGVSVHCQYAWYEFGNVRTTGTNGSGAIGQTGTATWGGLQTTHPSLTLGALTGGSATVGILGNAGNPSGDATHWSVGSGYSMVANQFSAANADAMYNEWRANGQTTVDFNYNLSNTGNVALIGLEILALVVAAIGTVTESDAAQPIQSSRTEPALGVVTENDAAQTIAPRHVSTLGVVTETDQAQALIASKEILLGTVTETDQAQPVTGLHALGISPAMETDVAQPIRPRRAYVVGIVTEHDVAQPIVVEIDPTRVAPLVIRMPMEMVVQIATDDGVTPPSGFVYIKRMQRTAPAIAPHIDANGFVDVTGWTAAFPQPVYTDWGWHRVVIGGRDVSFWKGVPAKVESWSKAQPFGDLNAVIVLPGVRTASVFPDWLGTPGLGDFRDVDIRHVRPDGTESTTWRWEGFAAAYGRSKDGLRIECVGSVRQLAYYLIRLKLDLEHTDLWHQVSEIIDPGGRERRQSHFKKILWGEAGPESTGLLSYEHGDLGDALKHLEDLLGQGWLEDGSNQWTVDVLPTRQPIFRLKDRTTHHFSIHLDEPGVTDYDLRMDPTVEPTAVYGEGIDSDSCHWANAKYPFLHPDGSTAFFGSVIGPAPDSSHGDSMTAFEQRAYDHGWTGFAIDGVYSSGEEALVHEIQRAAGLPETGLIDPNTWDAVFQPGANQGDLDGSYQAPLYARTDTEYSLYNAAGAVTGNNPVFRRDRLRVERYENFGDRITKDEGIRSARIEVARSQPAGWFGTIPLAVDPPEMSRFEITDGMNCLVRGLDGPDRLMHIAHVDAEEPPGRVTITVDEKARDVMTLGAMLKRDRTPDPSRRNQATHYNRKSRAVQDRSPTWDCENGAGIIPKFAVGVQRWAVIRIPAGQVGTIVESTFISGDALRPPAMMAVGVFDRAVTVNYMRSGARSALNDNGQAGDPLFFKDYWKTFGDELVAPWGNVDQPGGFSPGAFSDNDPITGVLTDDSTWYYETKTPPWLWIAFWVDRGNAQGVNYIQGRLKQSNEPF